MVAARACENLEPVNEVVEAIIKQNGDVNGTVKFWALPTANGWVFRLVSAARSRGPARAST